jgi:glycosyltransferase involved in cell wall biosynthesis
MVEFDIIIPVYKTEPHHLREAIDSVLKQTYQKFQIYISDGTPEDHEWHSKKILADYEDDRIHILQQEGIGIADARNQATEAGNNPYLALLDSDDTWYDLKLEDCANLLKENPNLKFMWAAADVDVVMVSNKGNEYKTTNVGGYHREWEKTYPPHRWFRIFWSPLMTSTHIYSRKAVETVGGWNIKHTMGEDTELNCKIAKSWPEDCLQIEAILGTYRVHINQTTQQGATHKDESGIKSLSRIEGFSEMLAALKIVDSHITDEEYWEWFEETLNVERGCGNDEKIEHSILNGTKTFRRG